MRYREQRSITENKDTAHIPPQLCIPKINLGFWCIYRLNFGIMYVNNSNNKAIKSMATIRKIDNKLVIKLEMTHNISQTTMTNRRLNE